MSHRPLIRTHRLLARSLLYGVPVLLLFGTWYVTRTGRRVETQLRALFQHDWEEVDWSDNESVRWLREYLRIDTSIDGNEIPGAELLARKLTDMGLEAHLEILGQRNANVWAILEGDDPRAVVLHSHIDVDPVTAPERWPFPPFGGHLEPPYIYGRGAFDMKSITIAQLVAIRELLESGAHRYRSLVFLATGSEEVGSHLGTRWILRQHPDLAARFGSVLTEGGAVETIDLDRIKYWGTEYLQKRFIDIRVCHGQSERLEHLRQDLLDPDRQGKLRLDRATDPFLRRYAETRDHPDFRRALLDPGSLYEDLTYEWLPRFIRSLLRDEVTAFSVEKDPEGGYAMWVILHLLPWVSFEEGWEELLGDDILADFDYSFEIPHGPLPASPVDHPVFQAIDACVREAYPGVEHGPFFIPWSATDSRFFRSYGIPSYGFSPFVIVTSDTTRSKSPGERIAAPAFVAGVELYTDLVRRLVAADG